MNKFLNNLKEQPFITEGLIALNVIYFIFLTLVGGTLNPLILAKYGALVPNLVVNGQWYRLITAMFIHIGFEHIILNMVCLYFLGRILEQVIGHVRYLIIYFFAGIMANILTLFTATPNTISAGASGAIFGIIGVWLMLAEQYRNQQYLVQMGRQMLLFSILGLLSGMFSTDINIWAHFGGLVSGFLSAYVIGFPKIGPVQKQKRWGSLLLLVCIMITFLNLAFTLYK